MTRTTQSRKAVPRPQMARPTKPDAISLLAAMKPSPSETAKPAAMPRPHMKDRKPKPGARAGTRQLAGHFPIAICSAMKFLMAEEDTTMQALLDEAINDLLVKKGRTKLANV